MAAMKEFTDGLINILSNLTNRRSATNANTFVSSKLSDEQLRAIYKSGLGSKIVKIKAGYALNDTLQFESPGDEEFYNKELAYDVLKAARFMVGFGRGIIVLYQHGDNLSHPFIPVDDRPIRRRVFSGDMVTTSDYETDFESDRYYKPKTFNVRGEQIHWSRVVDFTYYEPPEQDAANYNFGGVSEFEIIYPQLVNDAIVERASGSIVEKNATIFYKVAGFREACQLNKDKDILRYFGALEDARSIYGAGIIDNEDEAISLAQALTNLADVDNITLRRLAMVTGIPLAWLIGENVKGLNSTGDNERQIFQDMIETLEYEHLQEPINLLMKIYGRGAVEFKDNQGETALGRIEFETKVIDNAVKLHSMGEDYGEYLDRHDVTQRDDFAKFFGTDMSEAAEPVDGSLTLEEIFSNETTD